GFFFPSRRRHTRLQGDWEFRRVLFRSPQAIPVQRPAWWTRILTPRISRSAPHRRDIERSRRSGVGNLGLRAPEPPTDFRPRGSRSEERRVGKEGRYEWGRGLCEETHDE